MNVYVHKDDQQLGPFTEEELKEHLKSGKFTKQDLAWKEGLTDWTPLSNILTPAAVLPPAPVLPPVPAESSQAEKVEAPVKEETKLDSAKATFESIVGKAKEAGHLAQIQAQRKKLEVVDLKQADHKTGQKAYDNKIDPDKHPEIRAQIADVKQQIETLRNHVEEEAKTFTDKAKAAANAAGRTAKVEALNLKLLSLFADLGKGLRTGGNNNPALTDELAAGHKITETLRELDSEIESVSAKTFTWAKQPLLIAAVVVVLALGGAWLFLGHGNQNSPAALDAKLAELHRKELEDQVSAEKRRIADAAKAEKDRQAKEIQRQKEAQAAQAKADAEQKQAEIDRKQKEIKELEDQKAARDAHAKSDEQSKSAAAKAEADKAAAAKAQQEQAAADKQQEQKKLAAYAAEAFSKIHFESPATLSSSFTKAGATVELRGQELDKVQSFLKLHDYIGLLNFLYQGGEPIKEYPSSDAIDRAVNDVSRVGFSLLVKTTVIQSHPQNVFFFIWFPNKSSEPVSYDLGPSWTPHPDKIGYLHTWTADMGPVIVVSGSVFPLKGEVDKMATEATAKVDALKTKQSLGELDQAGYDKAIADLRKQTYDTVLQWAQGK